MAAGLSIQAVYKLIADSAIGEDRTLRDQVREGAASAVSQIEEGFARFYPKDFGRMVVGAKASLQECRGHLRDAVDRGHITEQSRNALDLIAAEALREIGGLLDYLQSPEAERNARRIKEDRILRRERRMSTGKKAHSPDPRDESEQ